MGEARKVVDMIEQDAGTTRTKAGLHHCLVGLEQVLDSLSERLAPGGNME